MKTLITHDGKFLTPLTSANGREPEALMARERIGLFASQPQGSQEMNLDDFLAGMRALGTEIKSQLISMDEEIDLVLVGLLTGENVFFLSLFSGSTSTRTSRATTSLDRSIRTHCVTGGGRAGCLGWPQQLWPTWMNCSKPRARCSTCCWRPTKSTP